jgi:D-alanine-D-alanine ligase
MTKRIFKGEGIPTPNFQVFKTLNEPLNPNLRFPLIVKPNREGSAKGINQNSIVNENEVLYERIEEIFKNYRQEALVEEFIEGKELTVGILEDSQIFVLPILEIDFSTCKEGVERFYSWRMKEYQGNKELGFTPTFFCPARIPKKIEEKIKALALRAHLALGCRGFSRIDLRLSEDDIPYFLEVNPLPGLDPNESNFPIMAKAAGIDYIDLIEIILKSGLEKRCN